MYAFYENTNITSVSISNSVTSIGNYAFEGCYKLVEVINKSSLTITKSKRSNGYVGYYALEIRDDGESKIVNKDGYLFYTYNELNYLIGYTGNDTALTLPESYNGNNYEIYKYAFYENTNITSVSIPNSVTSIGNYAFKGCTGLKTINYTGTKTEWNSISKGYDWNSNPGSYTINYNYTGK